MTRSDVELLLEAQHGPGFATSVRPELRQLYESSLSECWDVLTFGLDSVPPQIYVVYTARAHSRMVWFDDDPYLIYDQYLGQILSQMTRLVLNDCRVELSDAYLLRFLGQRCYVAGNHVLAAACGLLSAGRSIANDKAGIRLDDAPPVLARRGVWNLAQERFVIAHELAHMLLRAPSAQLAEWRREHLAAVLDVLGEPVAIPERVLAEGSLTDARAAWERRYGEPPPSGVAEAEARFVDEIASDPSRLEYLRSEASRLAEDEQLLEECACDALAAAVTAASLRERYPLLEVLPATAMALHNIRFLKLVDNAAATLDRAEYADEDPEVIRNALRLSAFRISLELLGESFDDGDGTLARDVRAQVVELNLAHARVLLDQWMLFVPSSVRKQLRDDAFRDAAGEVASDPTGLRELLNLR